MDELNTDPTDAKKPPRYWRDILLFLVALIIVTLFLGLYWYRHQIPYVSNLFEKQAKITRGLPICLFDKD